MAAIVASLVTVASLAVSAVIAGRHRDSQPVPRNGGPWETPARGPYSAVSAGPGSRRVSRSVLLGLACGAFWWLPLAAIVLALAAIGYGVSDIASGVPRGYARTGIYLAVAALIAAVAHAGLW
jgi:hypothetical protein